MTYKQEQQNIYQEKASKLTKKLPAFFDEYIMTLPSAQTRYSNMLKLVDWLEWTQKNGYIKSYELDEIDKIKAAHIIEYLDSLASTSKLATIIRKKSVIGSFLGFLFFEGYISCNEERRIPPQRFKVEKNDKDSKTNIPTKEDIQDLFKNIKNMPRVETKLRWNAIVNLIMGTGIQSGELLGLDVDDLHLDDNCPYIEVERGKKGKAKVAILKNRVEPIRDYLKWRNNNNANTDALFVSGYGERLSKGTLDGFFIKHGDGKITPTALKYWHDSVYNKYSKEEFVKKVLQGQ